MTLVGVRHRGEGAALGWTRQPVADPVQQAPGERGAAWLQVAPLAVAFVGYVVLWNVSLQLNSVGFYQLMKIMTLPAVVLLEYAMLRKRQTPPQLAAVITVCLGVGLATVADTQARALNPILSQSHPRWARPCAVCLGVGLAAVADTRGAPLPQPPVARMLRQDRHMNV